MIGSMDSAGTAEPSIGHLGDARAVVQCVKGEYPPRFNGIRYEGYGLTSNFQCEAWTRNEALHRCR